MKVQIIASALFVITTSALHAQVDSVAVKRVDSVAVVTFDSVAVGSGNAFYFGVKIGTNYSGAFDIEGEDFTPTPKFGLAGGFFATFPITAIFAVQPEVLFSQKGFKATGTLYDRSYKIKRLINYLDIPVFIQFRPTPALSIMIGPQYSYLISQKNVFYNASTTIAQEEAFDDDYLRRHNMAFVIGADLNKNHLVLGFRVGWEMQQNTSSPEVTTPHYKNYWGQLTLGYRF